MQGGPFEASAIFDVDLEIQDGEFSSINTDPKVHIDSAPEWSAEADLGTVIVNETD